MDETIGVKGGKNDRRRTVIIEENKKKKLQDLAEEKEIKELEKKVRKQQLYTLIKALPVVIGGEIVKTIHDTAVGKLKYDKEESNSKWRIKEYDADNTKESIQEDEIETEIKKRKIITTPTGQKIIVYVSNELEIDNEKGIEDEEKNQKEIKDNTYLTDEKSKDKGQGPNNEEKNKSEEEQQKKLVEQINEIDLEEYNYDDLEKEFETVDFSYLPQETQDKIEQLKSRKIVSEYEKQLKDIRFELRKAIFEYNVLYEAEDEIVIKKDAEVILDRLSDVITKVEELKERIKIENIEKYDDNYIYYLIEGYLDEFRNKNVINEIKDSPLYIMISEKINELDQKKTDLNDRVKEKKDLLDDKENHFEEIKKKYYNIEKINNQLLDIQNKQDELLKSIKEKVANATTITEQVKTEFTPMLNVGRNLIRNMAFYMYLSGPMYARGMAASAASYLYFINNIIKPNMTTKKYKVITVKDYSDEINSSLNELDDAILLLGKTSNQIDKIMNEIYNKYHEYFGVVKECDQIMTNLTRIKRDLKEKEYEMEKIKTQQQKELELNDQKIMTRGTYPVN